MLKALNWKAKSIKTPTRTRSAAAAFILYILKGPRLDGKDRRYLSMQLKKLDKASLPTLRFSSFRPLDPPRPVMVLKDVDGCRDVQSLHSFRQPEARTGDWSYTVSLQGFMKILWERV